MTDMLSPARRQQLRALESESIFIFREVAAESKRPVLLYSIGKDSSVLLHLALKAFEQTRRNAAICSAFAVPNIIVCVNKVHLVNFDEQIFRKIIEDFDGFSAALKFKSVHAVPTSAAFGDNVTHASKGAIARNQRARAMYRQGERDDLRRSLQCQSHNRLVHSHRLKQSRYGGRRDYRRPRARQESALAIVFRDTRCARARQTSAAVALWFTGLPGAGKTTIADMVDRKLHALGHHTMMIDGDNIRQGINRDLGFSEEDRAENIRRAAEVAKLMVEAGLLVLCCFITPYAGDRQMAHDIIGAEHFVEVFVNTPTAECVRRDPKGLYARAKQGQIRNLTGFSAPYEAPTSPDLKIQTLQASPESAAAVVLEYLVDHQYI